MTATDRTEAEQAGPPGVARRGLGLLGAAVTGSGIAIQAKINSALAARLDDGLIAALISFGVGFVLLVLLALTLPTAHLGLRRIRRALDARRLRWWHLTGGFCGALLVASQGLTVGILGVAVFTVSVVGGQVGSSLLMDRLGVGPAGVQPVTARRVLAAMLAVCAVGLAVSGRLAHPAGMALAVLPLLAGVSTAWQQGVNGQVGLAAARDERGGGDVPGGGLLGSTLPATLVNFITGTIGLAIAATAGVLAHGMPEPLPSQPWLYLGGALGMAIIAAMVVLVREIGVLLLGLGVVAGQLVASLLLDLFIPAADHPVTAITVVGTALTLVAVGIAAWAGRGPGAGRAGSA